MSRRSRINVAEENWLQTHWRPIAAMVYLIICIFDFIVAPVIVGINDVRPTEIAHAVKELDPQVASVLAVARPQWQPLTLQGSGLFHISFGAILGVAAWSRNLEKLQRSRNSNKQQE